MKPLAVPTRIRDMWNLVQIARPINSSPLLDVVVPRWSAPRASGFNGQGGRQSLLRAILREWSPTAVVELGTYRGDTTEMLWYLTGAPIVSVERNALFARAAARRFSRRDCIEVVNTGSVTYLQEQSDSLPTSDVLFYIDSHWKNHLPIADEVACITSRWRRSVIIVDDIRVPGDDGYGYFTEGPEPLTADSISGWHRGYTLLWPSLPSGMESGGRRGCAVLVADELGGSIGSLASLRAQA